MLEPHLLHDRAAVFRGDCAALGEVLAPESIDALVTDPPAGISFMGADWDSDKGGRDAWVRWLADALAPAFAAMKPGAHGLIWALPRTSHWTAWALELAGFELRDRITHWFATGFPKSLNVAMKIDERDAAQERRRRSLAFTEWMRSTGIPINELTRSNMGSHYLTDKEQPHVATADMFDLLRPHLGAVPEWVEVLVRERTVESENKKRREVVGHSTSGIASGTGEHNGSEGAYGYADEYDVTAPHTEAAKQWDGWGTGLKPACEDWWLVRKPLGKRTVAECVLEYGTGALNIRGCRIGDEEVTTFRRGHSGDYGVYGGDDRELTRSNVGRWPSHVVLSHSPDCEDAACTEDCPVRILDDQAGERRGAHGRKGGKATKLGLKKDADGTTTDVKRSSGIASRFYFVTKPSRSEKDLGLEHLAVKSGGEATGRKDGSAGLKNPRAGGGRTGGAKNTHPSPKGVDLMRYLCRLITPPGGTVLDMFFGSGTTGVAALAEGFNVVGIERDQDDDGNPLGYLPICVGRLRHALGLPPEDAPAAPPPAPADAFAALVDAALCADPPDLSAWGIPAHLLQNDPPTPA